ncbi:hypothetical protein BGZ94_000656, partial [Podila epigama]
MTLFSLLLLLAEIYVTVTLLLYKGWAPKLFQVGIIDLHNNNSNNANVNANSPHATPASSSLLFSNNTANISPAFKDMLDRIASSAGWIVLGSTGLSVCVLIWDWIQARVIVASDSIPRAFLNSTAFHLWSLRSYSHFCLLANIHWGSGWRQRVVTAIYFGLQGSLSVLVALPRLVLYGCVLYAASAVPDFSLSERGFQWLQIPGYTVTEGTLLSGTLVIMTLSTLCHLVYLLKILAAAFVCLCTLCCLTRSRKAMSKDLSSRISTLLQSKCQRNNSDPEPHLGHERKQESNRSIASTTRTDKMSMPEKTTPPYIIDSTEQRPSREEFQDISLDYDTGSHQPYRQHGQHQRNMSSQVSTAQLVSSSSLSGPDSRTKQVQGQAHRQAQGQPPYTASTLPPFTHPSMATSDMLPYRGLSTPNNRLAALSFYDDLLKSINSERMMYATSYSNSGNSQENAAPLQDEPCGKKTSLESFPASIALCSSITLSFPTSSEVGELLNSDQPIHPFDFAPEQRLPRHSPPLQQTVDGQKSNEHLMVHNEGQENSLKSQQQGTYHLNNSNSDLNRCGSVNSQETIEKWRIHVAPSSPTNSNIDHASEHESCETPTPYMQQNSGQLTPTERQGHLFAPHGRSSFELRRDSSDSRRGTIPIILSAQLQQQAAQFLDNDDNDLFFSAADLHIPRPAYAYGQSRTQRQGSVNSSVGGYNYSTAASSPSLADSLSNPMYQQQSVAMSGPMGDRPIPLRKGSLPSLNSSSRLGETPSSKGQPSHPFQSLHYHHHHHQQHYPQHTNYPSTPTKMQPRTPSHLSNMVSMHNMDQQQSSPPQVSVSLTSNPDHKPSTHYRSLSHGFQASGREQRHEDDNSHSTQWGSFGAFKEVQSGYTTMIDIPLTSMSHIGYETREESNHTVVRSGTVKSSNMSLQEALAFDVQSFQATGVYENTNQYRASRGPYRGPDMPDHLVHPLDLSPLMNHVQGGVGKPYHDNSFQDYNSTTDEAQQAWDEARVGLGLFMNDPQHQQHQPSQLSHFSSNETFCQRPTPIPLPTLQGVSHAHNDNDYQYYNDHHLHLQAHQSPQDYFYESAPLEVQQPEMISRMTSNATNLTHNSEQTTHASPHFEYSSTTITTTMSSTLHDDTECHRQGFDLNVHQDSHKNSPQQHHRFHQHPPQRQPSQRNKKNLVVAIVPTTVY